MASRPLDDLVEQSRLAIVGIAKNCGKTTTLNRLLRHRRAAGLAPPGLVSTGIDGEPTDLLAGMDKPPIAVHSGQWVVSAGQALRQSTARVEYVRTLGFSTPLGEVFACRVLDPGEVILAGLRHRRELVAAVRTLEELGADSVWTDGAYGRIAGAHPDVTDAVVVATGLVTADDIAGVVEKTENLVSRLTLQAIVDDADRELIDRAVDAHSVLLRRADGHVVASPHGTAITGLDDFDDWWPSDTAAVAVPGLVSDGVLEALLAAADQGVLLVPDATVIHADHRLWSRFRDRWTVRTRTAVEVVGISYNPTSAGGGRVDAGVLERELRAIHPIAPVFNPLQ